jgi:hypothetical protein
MPASIQITPDPLAIQCDGVDASTVTVRVTDARGKPATDGTVVFFDARYGFVDPIEVETRRGEASTQAHLYPYAMGFPGQAQVDVFVGPLRASIGLDCLPPEPCDPLESPPCPLPCSETDSPPVGPSPPCETPTPEPCDDLTSPPCEPCADWTSPPCDVCDGPMSPPCPIICDGGPTSPPCDPCEGPLSPPCGSPTPTPTPDCFPQSPPCEPCADWTSPPCDPCEEGPMSPPCVTPTPIGNGTVRFTSYDPVVAAVGTPFVLTLEAVDVDIDYNGYQYRIATPNLAITGDVPAAAHGMTVCAPPQNVGDPDPSFYGGCLLENPNLSAAYEGDLTTLTFTCLAGGSAEIRLISDDYFPTSLIARAGRGFGGFDPSTIHVTCTDPRLRPVTLDGAGG